MADHDGEIINVPEGTTANPPPPSRPPMEGRDGRLAELTASVQELVGLTIAHAQALPHQFKAVTYDITETDGTPGVDLVAWSPDTDEESWCWVPARHRCSRCRGAHQPWDLIAADAHLVSLGWKRAEPWSRTGPGVWECAVRETSQL